MTPYVFDIADFKVYFYRDFPFQPDPPADPPGVVEPDKYIQDADINKAYFKTKVYFDPEYACGCDDTMKIMLYNLIAHILCMDIKASGKGLNGGFDWPYSSKSVGSVSASSSIPSWITENPMYSYLAGTSYGVEYLMMIMPCLTGGFFVVEGATLP